MSWQLAEEKFSVMVLNQITWVSLFTWGCSKSINLEQKQAQKKKTISHKSRRRGQICSIWRITIKLSDTKAIS